VGFRKELVSKRFSMPLPTHSVDPEFGLQPHLTVGEALKGLPKADVPDHAAA